jgi:hypothetical protein
VIGYGRVICPDDRRTVQLGQTSIRRAPTHFAQQRLAAGEEGNSASATRSGPAHKAGGGTAKAECLGPPR